ncbi:CinA family protein [Paludibacterium paludis]|uniref:Nicotinamide-nucleotide amidohydrolase PncC n=1 Tax=Paludibacterium paludis TaxID=1225769 RepID=A0A918P568_9NEIS|nr:nicotinamide-nucleotide amidohydrolase family protein [Paludibacterium paludis]GGY20518.1 nicotinamide-nucleotide amidohydrolase PncC [Paludibacterium paludis]
MRRTELPATLGAALAARGETLATAESCTGGMVAAALTDIAGSSAWFGFGWVTYANEAKMRQLGVSARTLSECGAVSEATVGEMARGALAASGAHWAVAVSGIAGPGGAVPGKPVGTVWFAVARAGGGVACRLRHFSGDRAAVRDAAASEALAFVLECLAAS